MKKRLYLLLGVVIFLLFLGSLVMISVRKKFGQRDMLVNLRIPLNITLYANLPPSGQPRQISLSKGDSAQIISILSTGREVELLTANREIAVVNMTERVKVSILEGNIYRIYDSDGTSSPYFVPELDIMAIINRMIQDKVP